MENKGYEISDEGLIQVAMLYGMPHHGVDYRTVEKFDFTQQQVDQAIVSASNISIAKRNELVNSPLNEKDKLQVINTYAGFHFFKQLNFDVKLDETKFRLPQLSVVGYGYDQFNINRRAYDLHITKHLFDLVEVIMQPFYEPFGIDSFEHLKAETVDARIQNIRKSFSSEPSKNENKIK